MLKKMMDEIMIPVEDRPQEENPEGFARMMNRDEWNMLQGSFTPAELADAEEAYRLDRV